MTDTNHRGPVNSMGSLEVQSGNTATIEPFDGPSMFYQNMGWPDIRSAFQKDAIRPGAMPSFLSVSDIFGVDAIPQASGTATLAAAQVITSAVPMALATVGVTNFSSGAQSIAVGVPIIPQGTTVVVSVISLDFGFTTGTTVANSSTVQVADNTKFTLNQWLILGNVGNAAATQSLITQVRSIATANLTTITVGSNLPATALGVPIGGANLFGSDLLPPAASFGPTAPAATAHSPRTQAGLARVMNPVEMLARNIGVSGQTTSTAAFLVSGYDVWNVPMTELITVNATATVTTAWGKKAFKYISSVVPQSTFSTNYQIGIGDTFGAPFRFDEPEHTMVTAGGTAVSNAVGLTTAVVTPATNTSGDVRGTVQIGGNGAGTPISSVATSNNVRRLVIVQNIPPWNTIAATPTNLTPMFGTTQV